MISRPLVSVVIPVLNEADCLRKLHEELRQTCAPLPFDFEFLVVDDGSTDHTIEVLARLRQDDERVRYLSLSRNFGHQAALAAGLAHARGDAIITMDGDLQHPPALIPELLKRWQEGCDIVNTVQLYGAGIHPFQHFMAALWHKVLNDLGGLRLPQGTSDFRLLTRVAVNALNALPERQRFLSGLVPWLGFRQTYLHFRAAPRWAGRSKQTWRRRLRLALDGITSFSFFPLRRLALFGCLITLASLACALWAVASHLFLKNSLPGSTAMMICVLFLGGCQLMGLGVLGEYMGRALDQVKGRPLYLVRQSAGLVMPGDAALSDHSLHDTEEAAYRDV